MLDIDALRLTDEEDFRAWTYKEVAEAQLAKALDGIEAWLKERQLRDTGPGTMKRQYLLAILRNEIKQALALEQANIERPGAGKAD